jgi:diaminopimelate epimerase
MGEVNGIEEREDALFLDTGSPHHLEFVEELASIDVKQKGRAIRYGAPYFEEGSNVNFVQQLAPDTFKIRTYERGVEDETLACGTGAVAAAIAAYHRQLTSINIVNIDAAGGKLKVSFSPQAGKYKDIRLEGPATFVFSGNIKIG